MILKKNRECKDVRKFKKGYDIEAAERLIEVKGIEKSFRDAGNWRFIQQSSVQLMLTMDNFFIYVVDNVEKDLKLRGIYILEREKALRFLKIPQGTYDIRVPASERENLRVK